MKNFKRVLSLALAALMVIGGLVVAPVDAKAADTVYNLVPGQVNALKACIEDGGKFVLVAKYDNKYYAIGQTYTGYRSDVVEVSVDESAGTMSKLTAAVPEWDMKTKGNGVTLSYGDTYLKLYKTSSTTFSETTADDAEEWLVAKKEGLFNFTSSRTTTGTIRGIVFRHQDSGDCFGGYAISNGGSNGYVADLMVFYSKAIPSYENDPVIYANDEEVVNAAYELEAGESIANVSVTGVITAIDAAYNESFKNVNVVIQVGDLSEKKLLCYRMKGTDADKLTPGDTITVSGTIVNYNGTIEFNSGCTFTNLTKGNLSNVTISENASDADVINAMKNVAVGVSALGNQTLEGVVKEIKTAYDSEKKTITTIIEVEGTTVKCYKVSGELGADVAVDGKMTVTGKLIMTEYGLCFDNGTVTNYVAPSTGNEGGNTNTPGTGTEGGNTTTNPNMGDMNTVVFYIVLFAGVSLVAVSVLGKKKMA